MSIPIEIDAGVACSGKTSRLLNLYREELSRLLRRATPGQTLWIAPTQRARRGILRQLLDGNLRTCFAPNVFTFDGFAERVLRTSGLEIRALSPVRRRVFVRRLVDQACDEGKLEHFAPIADTIGFLDLVLGFISALKREEIWPQQLEAAWPTRNVPREVVELATLYRRYQERLVELGLYDAEGRFWSAREALEQGRRGAFSRLSLVVVDGFADFTQPQYEILKHLAESAQRIIVSLPGERVERSHRSNSGNITGRTALFAKSLMALEEICRRCKTTSWQSSEIAAPRNAVERTFRHLADHLFDNPGDFEPLPTAEGLEIIEAAGPAGEARGIVKRVKALLYNGVPADQIVVASRDAADEADFVAEWMAAAKIPHWCQSQRTLLQTPVAKVVLSLLEAEEEDWVFPRLFSVLRSSYFHPKKLTSEQVARLRSSIPLICKRHLGSNLSEILAGLDRVAADETDKSRGEATATARGLRILAAARDVLRQPAPFSVWIDRLVAVCEDLGIGPSKSTAAPADRLDQQDIEHWRQIRAALFEGKQAQELFAERAEMTLSEFARQLRELLGAQALEPTRPPDGCVLLLDAADVRNLDVGHLILFGLTEGSFPRPRRDDCLLTQAERRRAIGKESTEAESQLQEDELLLFYSIVTRARRSLTLAYSSVSSDGQPLFPSPYLAAITELYAPGAILRSPAGNLDPVPPFSEMLIETDLPLVACEQTLNGDAALFGALANRPDWKGAARSIVAAADMATARFCTDGFSQYDGMLRNEGNRLRLQELFPSQYEFSPTQLEAYATCPFRFLLQHVLRIEPCEFPDLQFDARQRGMALHRILATLHEAHCHQAGSAPDGTAIAAALRRLIRQEYTPRPGAGRYEKALAAAERLFAERFADLYARHWDEYQKMLEEGWETPPSPRLLEFGFGQVPDDPERSNRRSAPAVQFGSADSAVYVRGKIDRIDVGQRQGSAAFTVIDYKTREGGRFHLNDVRSGVSLQLAIYAAAVRRLALLGRDAILFELAHWNLTRSGCVSAIKDSSRDKLTGISTESAEQLEHALDTVLPRIARGIRQGEFPVQNADKHCTGHCAYHAVCRVGQIRSVAKERKKLWTLVE